jgi:putative ABC transport system permease protein
MTSNVSIIPLSSLALILIPVTIVLWIQFKWSLNYKEGLYAVSRMLGQLLFIGYFLGYIFNTNSYWIVLSILSIMFLSASWIALQSVKARRLKLFSSVLISLLIGGLSTLILVTQGVLDIKPWYNPQFVIPLAGMIFANSMNSISLAAERYFEERQRQLSTTESKRLAFKIAMISKTNVLFAVGLVSLPGMMTGQILSGVDPLIAVRYQIMVMGMIYGGSGISSAIFLQLVSKSEASEVDLAITPSKTDQRL